MCGGVDQMRFIEILDEDSAPNTLSSSLKKQADMKSDQAKKLKKQASVQKKREQVNPAPDCSKIFNDNNYQHCHFKIPENLEITLVVRFGLILVAMFQKII